MRLSELEDVSVPVTLISNPADPSRAHPAQSSSVLTKTKSKS